MENPTNIFNWVYDCGSKRSQALKDALKRVESWETWIDPIDMLVFSHFDDDHVNGLEDLLKQRRVKSLVLPFSDWQQRLREAAIGGTKGINPSTAHLQLDPVGWLESRRLSEQVETLVLIQGGRSEPNEEPLDSTFLPTGPNRRNEDNNTSQDQTVDPAQSELRMGSDGDGSALKIQVLRHQSRVLATSLPMEFMFYNAELSGSDLGIIETVNGISVSKKSKLPLTIVRQRVDATISALGLTHPFSALPPNWRAQLKACYEQHFGSTGKARNNISLCLYVRPLPSFGVAKSCGLFTELDAESIDITDHNVSTDIDDPRPAVLCTGDLKLDKNVIAAMQTHFGKDRWSKIGITQVPHHGSTHSWETGNAALLSPSNFVHCAPGSVAHPHANVAADLIGQNVFIADYKNSVTLKYHFTR